MSTRVYVGFSKDGSEVKMMATVGRATVLKARFSSTPSHPRAFQWLLEALALWEGQRVHAVLCVDGAVDAYGRDILRDWFPDFGSALYTIEWTDRETRRTPRDGLQGLGDFSDLRQLRLFSALESQR